MSGSRPSSSSMDVQVCPGTPRASARAADRQGERRGAGVLFVPEEFLPLADHAEGPVVQDEDLHGMPYRAQVSSSRQFIRKPPSPAKQSTGVRFLAREAPMAAGRAYPMVPRPPEVKKVPGSFVL